MAVSSAGAGELDAEYGAKAKATVVAPASSKPSSELDSESPTQACCFKRWLCGYRGYGYGGYGYGGFGGGFGYGGFGGYGGYGGGFGYGGFGGYGGGFGYGGFGGYGGGFW